jgi:hypothetical protein
MKKIKIDNFKLNEEVLITSFNPPLKAKVMDMYELEPTMVDDQELKKKYPKGIPVFEVVLEENGKLSFFVKDVVKKILVK